MPAPSLPQPNRPTQADAYDALPEYVKCQVPRAEWLWLSEREKATLHTDLTEPPPE